MATRNRTRKAFQSHPAELQDRVARLLKALEEDGLDVLVRESDQTPQLPCRILLTDDGALVAIQDSFELVPPRALSLTDGLEIALEKGLVRGALPEGDQERVNVWKTRLGGLQAAPAQEQWWSSD